MADGMRDSAQFMKGARRGIAGGAGLAFVLLSIVGIATIGHYPRPEETASAYVRYFAEHRDAILLTNALLSLANGALIIYFAHIKTSLSTQAQPSPLPTLAFAGCLLLCALGAAGAALTAGLAWFGTSGVPPAVVKLLQNLYYTTNAFSAMPAALAVGSVALAAAARGAARWLVLFSAAIAAIELAATFTLQGHGSFFSPAGTFGAPILYGSLTMWVLVTSLRWLSPLAVRDSKAVQPA